MTNIIMPNIKIMFMLCAGFIAVMFMLLILLLRNRSNDEAVLEAKNKLNQEDKNRMKGISETMFKKHQRKYNEIQVFLSQTGANYMLKRTVDPAEYVLASCVIGIFSALAMCILFQSALGLAAFVPGCYILKFVLIQSNEQDNDAILDDIISIYNTLKIKTEGGMFLTSALQECYKVVENKRLKGALLELTGEISTKNNVDGAIKKFQLKFKNRFLNSFSLIVSQAYESGQMLNSLSDITNYLMEVQRIKNVKESQKLESDITKVEMLLLMLMTVVCLYVVYVSYANLLSETGVF